MDDDWVSGLENGGWRIRYYEEEINGVHILRAEVPGTPHTARGGRLQRKAMEVLRRNGVSRFLNPELVGARKVATGPLWRAMAAPLALTRANRLWRAPGGGLGGAPRGTGWTGSVITCCTALAAEVRALSLDIPDCEPLAWALQRRFGIPVLEQGGDLNLCFSGRNKGLTCGGIHPGQRGLHWDAPGWNCRKTVRLNLS